MTEDRQTDIQQNQQLLIAVYFHNALLECILVPCRIYYLAQLSGARVGLYKMFVLSSLVAQVGYSVERHKFKPRPKCYILSVLFSVCSSTFIFILHQLISRQAMEMGREIKASHCLKKQKPFNKIFGNIKKSYIVFSAHRSKTYTSPTNHNCYDIVLTL